MEKDIEHVVVYKIIKRVVLHKENFATPDEALDWSWETMDDRYEYDEELMAEYVDGKLVENEYMDPSWQ